LTSNQMVDQATSDAQQLIQDGGSSSKLMEHSSKISETLKLYLSKVESTAKTETSLLKTRMERFTNNGRSSMLTSMRKNQLRDNLTRSSVSMLKEISTLFLNYQITDI
jgi:hypothetical protein